MARHHVMHHEHPAAGVADPDTEVHNVLLHHVFPSRAHIIDTSELRALLRAH